MYGWEARFPLEAETTAEANSLEKAIEDICTADIDNRWTIYGKFCHVNWGVEVKTASVLN